jgi:hypothetical protein
MFELYFILYRVPKMMSRLARERNRSAVGWSLIGIAAWLGAEFVVALAIGMVYAIGSILFGWSPELPVALRVFTYVAALAAALGGFTLVRRILHAKSSHNLGSPDLFATPPPLPDFS